MHLKTKQIRLVLRWWVRLGYLDWRIAQRVRSWLFVFKVYYITFNIFKLLIYKLLLLHNLIVHLHYRGLKSLDQVVSFGYLQLQVTTMRFVKLYLKHVLYLRSSWSTLEQVLKLSCKAIHQSWTNQFDLVWTGYYLFLKVLKVDFTYERSLVWYLLKFFQAFDYLLLEQFLNLANLVVLLNDLIVDASLEQRTKLIDSHQLVLVLCVHGNLLVYVVQILSHF